MAKDGVVSIAIDYKNELNQMIRDYESALTEMASNDKLSKGMKAQFDNTIAELKRFKADMEKSFSDLSIGKVDKNSFNAFRQTVNKNFESVRAEIDNLNSAVSTINSQIKILGGDLDISKISSQFKDFQDYVQNTNNAIDTMIKKLDGQGISLMSFDDSAVNQAKSQIKEINKLLKSTDEFSDAKGSKYELFDTDQAQAELDVLARDLKNTLELIEKSESELSHFDKNSIGFEKTINQINILKLKAADLHDSIQQLMDIPDKTGEYTFGDSILISDDNVDKKVSEYGKIVKGTLDEIRESAIKTREELEKIITPTSFKTASAKISDKLNLNSAELVTGITIETTSSELWKKLSPIIKDLQNILNKNPVVAPVKLVVAPNAVSSEKNGEVGTVSKSYSKKYQRELAKTGEDAIIDLEGVYKKTFTSIMDEAVSYSKETISKIQNIFESSPIKLYFDFNEEEFKKLSDTLLSSDSGKKIDITGQIAESKKEVNELAEKLAEVNELLNSADSKDFNFKGFDKFAEEISKSLGQLTELQSMLKTLQNIESTLARASGVSSVTDIETQWKNVSKLIENSIKLDGTFRKNANTDKLASEYNKYLNMGGTNELSSIGKIGKLENSKNIIDAIFSKIKELTSQKVDTSSIDKADDELKSVSSTLDDVISRLDNMINLTRDIGNTFYKMFKDASVSDVDKQWSSIESKFKSIADESGKINLSKQKKDIQELVEMYQKYTNAGGMKTLFDLTDNTETIKKMNKVYEQMNSKKDGTSVMNESKNFTKVEDSVNSLTSAINTKTEAIKTEANTMELAARSEIKSIQKIIDALNPLIEKIENIPELMVGNNFNSKAKNELEEIKALITELQSFGDGDEALTNIVLGNLSNNNINKILSNIGVLKKDNLDMSKFGIGSGFGKAILGENYALVMRPLEKKEDEYKQLISNLNNAYNSGANVSRILDVVIDKEHNLAYEIQEVAKGYQAYEDESSDFFNPKIYEATDEQLKQLVIDLKKISDSNLVFDSIGNNIKFDGSKFSFFDLDVGKNNAKDSINNTIQKLFERGGFTEQGKTFLNRLQNEANKLFDSLTLDSVIKGQDEIQSELKETQIQAEKTVNAVKDTTSTPQESNISSENIDKKYLEGEKIRKNLYKINSEIGLTEDEFIRKLRQENEEVKNGNREFQERLALLKDGKVIESYFGDKASINISKGTIGEDYDKAIHTHSPLEGSSAPSFEDLKLIFDSNESTVKEFVLFWNNEMRSLKAPGDTSMFSDSFKNLQKFIDALSLLSNDRNTFSAYVNAYLSSIAEEAGLAYKQVDALNNELQQGRINSDDQKIIQQTMHQVTNLHASQNQEDEINNISERGKHLSNTFIQSNESAEKFEITVENLFNTLSSLWDKIESNPTNTNAFQILRDEFSSLSKDNINNILYGEDMFFDADGDANELKQIAQKIYDTYYVPLINGAKELQDVSGTATKDAFPSNEASASVEKTTQAIKEENSALDETAEIKEKIAEVDKSTKYSFDEKESQNYWNGRFKESLKDITATNEELVRMKKYYEDLEKEFDFSGAQKNATKKLSTYNDSSKYTPEFIERVNSKIGEIKQLDITKSEDVARLKTIDGEIQKIVDDSKLLENKLVKQDSKITDIISQMKIFRSQNTNMSSSQKQNLDSIINYAEELKNVGKVTAQEIEKIKISFSGLKADVASTGNMGKNFFSQIGNRLTDMNSKFVAQFLSWQDWIRYIQQGINTIRELDEAMTEVHKVSEATESQYASFQRTIASTAKEIASTNKELLNSSADFLRLGYNLEQAEDLAKNATLFVNVGDGVDTTAATEDMITAMKAFDIKAEESIKIVDDYNQIGKYIA